MLIEREDSYHPSVQSHCAKIGPLRSITTPECVHRKCQISNVLLSSFRGFQMKKAPSVENTSISTLRSTIYT